MTKEEMITAVKSIKQPIKEKKLIFQLAKELGLTFKPTNCGKCLKDYVAILKETLGLIENAAEESGFDEKEYEWVYLPKRPQFWNGNVINQDTDPEIIEEFVKRFPKGYFKKVEKEQTEPQQEETINNEE